MNEWSDNPFKRMEEVTAIERKSPPVKKEEPEVKKILVEKIENGFIVTTSCWDFIRWKNYGSTKRVAFSNPESLLDWFKKVTFESLSIEPIGNHYLVTTGEIEMITYAQYKNIKRMIFDDRDSATASLKVNLFIE